MHTRQQNETENARDMSRMIETGRELSTLGEIFRKTVFHKLTNFDHFKDEEDSVDNTIGATSSRPLEFSARIRASCRRDACVYDPSAIVKIAVLNNHRMRALSARVFCWLTSPGANKTVRVKRDLSRLVCNTACVVTIVSGY
jgi:hypothetical protein